MSRFHAVSGPTKQQLREGQTGGSNVASEASHWCNRRETNEIQVRAYSGQRGTRTRMRSIHSVSIVHYVYAGLYVCSYWQSLFNVRQCIV